MQGFFSVNVFMQTTKFWGSLWQRCHL